MVSVGEDNFFCSSHFPVDVGRVRRQKVSLQLVLQEHVVLRWKANASSKEKEEEHSVM